MTLVLLWSGRMCCKSDDAWRWGEKSRIVRVMYMWAVFLAGSHTFYFDASSLYHSFPGCSTAFNEKKTGSRKRNLDTVAFTAYR